MQLINVTVPKSNERSFYIRKDMLPYFHIPWHYHAELELTYIIQGRGTRFVGDSIQPYTEGDLVLVGRDLPHFWNSDKEYYEETGIQTEAIVLQFTEDFAGAQFLQCPETKRLTGLYERARRGIRITGTLRALVISRLQQLLELSGFDQMVALLSLLGLFGSEMSTEETLLASPGYHLDIGNSGDKRIERVFAYVMNHFQEDISLADVAMLINMSPSAFCRYFKTCTRKSFVRFLNEVRVGYACKLLMERRSSITEIGFSSGFNNLSNFHLQFKALTNLTPSQYAQKHR